MFRRGNVSNETLAYIRAFVPYQRWVLAARFLSQNQLRFDQQVPTMPRTSSTSVTRCPDNAQMCKAAQRSWPAPDW